MQSVIDELAAAAAADISAYKGNENFIRWMMETNRIDREAALALDEDRYLGGYCEDFALYFAVRWGVDMLFLNREHDIVRIGREAPLYFDAADCAGVPLLSMMKYVRRSPRLSALAEPELEALLEPDGEWRRYRPLASRVWMIEKAAAPHGEGGGGLPPWPAGRPDGKGAQ